VLRQDANSSDYPLSLTAVKSRCGYLVEAAGIASLIRAVMANIHGFMTPNCHLYQINPHVEPENKENYLSEALDFPMESSYYGVTSRGFAGTNVHVLCYGNCDSWKLPDATEDKSVPLNFWPAGGGDIEDGMIAGSGYFIAGTFNGWQPEKMGDMGNTTYGYPVTLGENRWEDFVIMLDKQKMKTIHPKVLKGAKGCPIAGPDGDVQNCWRINGMSTWVEGGPALADGAADTLAKTELTAGDTGKPGDKYLVMLKVAGKFKTVVWEKLGESAPAQAGSYSIAADWLGWSFQKMTQDGDSWTLEFMLPKKGGNFQIVRNEDWHQVICPTAPKADASVPGFGPEDSIGARGYTWSLGGSPGDVFKITFKRTFGSGHRREKGLLGEGAHRRAHKRTGDHRCSPLYWRRGHVEQLGWADDSPRL
jgi:hypothetical protein